MGCVQEDDDQFLPEVVHAENNDDLPSGVYKRDKRQVSSDVGKGDVSLSLAIGA